MHLFTLLYPLTDFCSREHSVGLSEGEQVMLLAIPILIASECEVPCQKSRYSRASKELHKLLS